MDRHEWSDTDASNDSQIGQLLKLSGRRRMPADAQLARARVAAREEWERAVRIHRWSLWRPVLTGTVAVLLVALGAFAIWNRPSTPGPVAPVEVATLHTVKGPIALTRDGADRELREAGLRLQTGDRITSNDSRAALIFADGVALRLDRETAVTLASGRVTLLRGAAYVDAGPEPHGSGLAIETPLGVVRHIGTQFEVRLLGDTVRVRVREGAVVVERESARWTSRAGEALLIAPNRSAEHQTTTTSGPDWNWISELAEPFQLEGSTLESFLEWTAREQGWRWEFESPALQRRVKGIVLRGSIEGLTPEEALLAVLPTCGLVARRSGDRLIVGAARSTG